MHVTRNLAPEEVDANSLEVQEADDVTIVIDRNGALTVGLGKQVLLKISSIKKLEVDDRR